MEKIIPGFNSKDYQAQQVAIQNMTPAQIKSYEKISAPGRVNDISASRMGGIKGISAEMRAAQNEAAESMALRQAQFAEQQSRGYAERASQDAQKQSLRGARTAGLNPAQAAQLAAESASGAYNAMLNQGMNQMSQNFAGQQGIAGSQAAQELAAAQANQATALATGQQNAQLQQAAALANQQSGLTQNQQALTAAQANQQAGLTVAQQNAQLQQAAAQQNQAASLQAQQANQAAAQQAAALNQQGQITAAQLAQQAAAQNNQASLGAWQAGQQNDLAWRQAATGVDQYNRNAEQSALSTALGMSGPGAGYSNTDATQGINAISGLVGNVGGLLAGSGGADAVSDKNQKDCIKDTDPLDGVRGVRSVEYNYKTSSGEDPSPKRVGILAQDLEKTPLKAVVKETSRGKVVDTPQLTLANTSMIAELTKKLDKAMKFYQEAN
jgi:hypothetical protein